MCVNSAFAGVVDVCKLDLQESLMCVNSAFAGVVDVCKLCVCRSR